MKAPAEAVIAAVIDDRTSCLDNEVSALRALLADLARPTLPAADAGAVAAADGRTAIRHSTIVR